VALQTCWNSEPDGVFQGENDEKSKNKGPRDSENPIFLSHFLKVWFISVHVSWSKVFSIMPIIS
jgi:hypothetical protein